MNKIHEFQKIQTIPKKEGVREQQIRDDENYALTLLGPSDWINDSRFPVPLGKVHKKLIEESTGWLNDDIINGVQVKIRSEFPNIRGLQITQYGGLYNTSRGLFDQKTSITPKFNPLPLDGEFVQILNLRTRNHWICISGKLGNRDIIEIDVYDSKNLNIVNDELNSQVSSLLRNHKFRQIEYIFHLVTQQLDGSACGVHSIANAISFCYGLKPGDLFYLRSRMRQHLIESIESGNLLDTFEYVTIIRQEQPTRIRRFRVYCDCRRPFIIGKSQLFFALNLKN